MSLIIKTAEDLKAEAEARDAERRKQEAQNYLNSTDWMVIREAEKGIPVPTEITEKREIARQTISEARAVVSRISDE